MRPLASPAALDAATPADRDRYLDVLRALAIAVVVVGHWLTAVVWVDGDGLHASTLLERLPASRWATWLVQIMPVFFLVGGVVNARSWRSVRARGGDWATWVRARATRLLRPVLPLLWVWAALCAGLAAAGVDPALLRQGSLAALVPLWFIAVYLLVIAATPAALAIHARAGRWSPAVPVALGVAAAGVDVAHLAGVEVVGFANFFLVWAAVHQLGICWGDGSLQRCAARGSNAPWMLLGGGLGVLIVLVGWGGYPVSMVGVDGLRSNTSPPSVALVALGFAQAGVVLAVADRVRRRLASPRLWRGVVAVNLVAMTVYLWHSTAMVGVTGLAYALGGPMQEAVLGAAPLSLEWWVKRPLWVLLLALALAPLVAAFRRVERVPPAADRVAASPLAARLTLAALVVASAGIARIVTGGMPGHGAIAGSVGFAAPELLAVTLAGAWLGASPRPTVPSPGA